MTHRMTSEQRKEHAAHKVFRLIADALEGGGLSLLDLDELTPSDLSSAAAMAHDYYVQDVLGE